MWLGTKQPGNPFKHISIFQIESQKKVLRNRGKTDRLFEPPVVTHNCRQEYWKWKGFQHRSRGGKTVLFLATDGTCRAILILFLKDERFLKWSLAYDKQTLSRSNRTSTFRCVSYRYQLTSPLCSFASEFQLGLHLEIICLQQHSLLRGAKASAFGALILVNVFWAIINYSTMKKER